MKPEELAGLVGEVTKTQNLFQSGIAGKSYSFLCFIFFLYLKKVYSLIQLCIMIAASHLDTDSNIIL